MKNKTFILVVIVLIATLVTATPALAWYTDIVVEVRNSKTGAFWGHTCTVTVYDANKFDGTVKATDTRSDGSFTFSSFADPGSPDCLIFKVEFASGAGYDTPPTQWHLICGDTTNQGDYGTVIIYTDTGPNVVTLADADAQSPNVWLAAALGVGALVGAGGAVLFLRRRRVA